MIRRRFIAAGILGTVTFVGAWQGNMARAQSAPPNPPAQAKSSEFPLTGRKIAFTPMPLNGSPIVTLRINGKDDVKFAVSTSYPVSTVSSTLVKKLGLTVQYRPEKDETKTPIVTFASIEPSAGADTFKLVDTPFVVEEALSLNEYTDTLYGGVIAGNILQNFAVVFDYEANRLFLLNGPLNDTQLQSLRVANGLDGGIPMTAYDPDNLTFTIPVHVGKNTFPVLISSVSRITMVSDTKKKLNLDKADHYPGQFRAVDTPPYILPVSDFNLGDGSGRHDTAKIRPLKPFDLGIDNSPNPPQPPVLGLDYLTRFLVIIDYPARKFYATPVMNSANHAFPTEASRQAAARSFQDGSVYPSEEGKWIFTSVPTNGDLALSGIQNGDVIETVNGKKANGLTLRALVGLFHALTHTDEMGLLRNGKPIKVSVYKP